MLARSPQRGSIAPLLAMSAVALFSFVALAIDMGMLVTARTQCQNAADDGTLTGTRILNNKPTATDNDRLSAESMARTAVKNNFVLNKNITDSQIVTVQTGLYIYDYSQQRFLSDFTSTKPAGESWTALKVSVQNQQQSYFSKLIGVTSLSTNATAVAAHRPRDIAFVLDFSGSMRFGSTNNWGSVYISPPYGGSISADPSYPKFSHYQRYLEYSTNPSNYPYSAAPVDRPNPLYATTGYVLPTGELLAPANLTVATESGPPCVDDFYFDPSNLSSPTTPAIPVNPALLTMGFHRGLLPKPSNYEDQSGSYDGDRWPRKNGVEYTTSTSWDPTVTTGAARNLAELLGWVSSYTTTSTPAPASISRAVLTPSSPSYAADGSDLRDANWEQYGYDMDVADYRSNRPAPADPRKLLPANTTGNVYGQVKVTSGKFKGYSMGPSYWGKTFFIWPPDPRAQWDWRRKFFLNSSGAPFDPQADNDAATAGDQSISQVLLTNGGGKTVQSSGFVINYPAVLAWLKSGPQVLPTNLRAGKVLYYSSIPDDVNTSIGSTDQILDKAFWKNYIDFVLGTNYTGHEQLYGHESIGWPETTVPSILPTAQYVSGTSVVDPKPYTNYFDNPSRPRLHFWFGPSSMMSFLCYAKGNWWPGTVHEAQCWQLKTAINSALSDIRNNHPNDFAGLCFFAHNSSYYRQVRAPMSQDWAVTKNSLFYPFSLASTATPTSTDEMRPYDQNFNTITNLVNANIPNSNGGTDPNSGFAMAYNLLSSSPSVNPDPYKRGRRGAAKVVIFETDGVPNSYQDWVFNSFGYDSYYTNTGLGWSPGNNDPGATYPAFDIVRQICKPASQNNNAGSDNGFSLPNTPARVYAIGFGDLFGNPLATQQAAAKQFLLDVQKLGGTSPAGATSIPSDQLIFGDYNTRITNLRNVLERIMQSGVQVTLIE